MESPPLRAVPGVTPASGSVHRAARGKGATGRSTGADRPGLTSRQTAEGLGGGGRERAESLPVRQVCPAGHSHTAERAKCLAPGPRVKDERDRYPTPMLQLVGRRVHATETDESGLPGQIPRYHAPLHMASGLTNFPGQGRVSFQADTGK